MRDGFGSPPRARSGRNSGNQNVLFQFTYFKMRVSVERGRGRVRRERCEWYFFGSNCKIHLLPSATELIDAFQMLLFSPAKLVTLVIMNDEGTAMCSIVGLRANICKIHNILLRAIKMYYKGVFHFQKTRSQSKFGATPSITAFPGKSERALLPSFLLLLPLLTCFLSEYNTLLLLLPSHHHPQTRPGLKLNPRCCGTE